MFHHKAKKQSSEYTVPVLAASQMNYVLNEKKPFETYNMQVADVNQTLQLLKCTCAYSYVEFQKVMQTYLFLSISQVCTG